MSISPALNISRRGFDSSTTEISMRPICGRRLPFIESATALVAASAATASLASTKRSSAMVNCSAQAGDRADPSLPVPRAEATFETEALAEIKGVVPSVAALPPGCHFEPRCPEAVEACRAALAAAPRLRAVSRVGVGFDTIDMPTVETEDRAAFNARPLTMAVREVARESDWPTGVRFFREISDQALTEADHVMVADLARELKWIAESGMQVGGAAPRNLAEAFVLFNRNGGQTFQRLVAGFRVYNSADDFGGDHAALNADLGGMPPAPAPGPASLPFPSGAVGVIAGLRRRASPRP